MNSRPAAPNPAVLIGVLAAMMCLPARAQAENLADNLADPLADPLADEPAAALFAQHCGTCHGPEGRGIAGVLDLADGVWQFGSAYEDIERSIAYGRRSVMPALGMALGESGLDQVVGYVLSLSGAAAASPDQVTQGGEMYRVFCASCHAENGKGTAGLGARDLTDGFWRYGGGAENIRDVVANGRASEMPAQREILAADEIELLTRYVASLSNAQSGE